ncbi:MAG: LysR family transcriptional regulator, partial [Oscillospiraceae bacterium]|nr:LysR family transcriptional regulator [Oscillospiraceae bacterium]
MTVRHLRIFIAVYQTENITRAAEQLHMTQPTVTRAVQELERYYGVKLFERVNRRIYVTESGRQLYARAVHIVDSLDRLEREMKDRDRSAALRVGATATPGSTLLPDCMAAFAKSHPDTPLKLTVAEASALRAALLDSRLDFAVSEEPIEDRRLRAEVLAQDRLVALLPPDDPRAAAPA